MARSQPYAVPLTGGLIKSNNSLELLRSPGVATKLRNFEVSIEGGYRRINGYSVYSTNRPNTSNDVEGVFVYADGMIACVGTNIYFTQNGSTWVQINKDSVSGSGDNYSTFTGRSGLTITGQDQCQFALYEGSSDYGEVIITDKSGNNKPFYFKMTGTGDLNTRTYYAKQITISGSVTAKFCIIHDKHLVVAGDATNPNTLYISGTNDVESFSSTGSSSVTLEDQIVGLKSFRNELFIFCQNSIFKLQNINDLSNIAIVPVTKNVGCVDGNTIQEIGGDLIFLAPDGLRTVAGTARIGDVELGTVSKAIQPLINDIMTSTDTHQFSSVVLRNKSQYRMYYLKSNDTTATARGIIGTLRPNGWEWSETLGIEAPAVTSGFNSSGVQKTYHGDRNGYIYNHDTGNSFNPAGISTNILSIFQSPDFDYGDLGTLKTLDYVKVFFSAEGEVNPVLRTRYNYGDSDTPQPADITLAGILPPALFGTATFGDFALGGVEEPFVRQALTGTGYSNFFKISTEDTNSSYTINGLYVSYRPSGRL